MPAMNLVTEGIPALQADILAEPEWHTCRSSTAFQEDSTVKL